MPIKNNQLSYNPIHMAFSIFKNHSAVDIMKADDKENKFTSKLKSTLSWSQNGRYVSKPLPYSNTQKINLNVNVDNLVNEKNAFKLAIHAKLSEQIVGEFDPSAGCVVNRDPRVLIHGRDIFTVSLPDAPYGGKTAE